MAFAAHVAAGLTNQRGSLLRGLEAAKLLKTCLVAPSWCVCSGAGAENGCAHDVYLIHMRGRLGQPSPCASFSSTTARYLDYDDKPIQVEIKPFSYLFDFTYFKHQVAKLGVTVVEQLPQSLQLHCFAQLQHDNVKKTDISILLLQHWLNKYGVAW